MKKRNYTPDGKKANFDQNIFRSKRANIFHFPFWANTDSIQRAAGSKGNPNPKPTRPLKDFYRGSFHHDDDTTDLLPTVVAPMLRTQQIVRILIVDISTI